MPWKESSIMDERTKFISKLLQGEKMTHVCEEFNISRKTGHKLWNRYQAEGAIGLEEKSRAPHRRVRLTPPLVEKAILGLKKKKSHWGAAKIRELFIRKYSGVKVPARSTFHAIFERHGLVKKRRRNSRTKLTGTWLSVPKAPNDLWCADFKGEFLLTGRPKRYCYPLTISDNVSRYLISCEALDSVKTSMAFPVFEEAFKEYGLPKAIRTDNGVPFSTSGGLFGWSLLSVWWLRLGIKIERIRPGHPEENGRHERIHRTLKATSIKPSACNILQQQERFDNFIEEYNKERPHEALKMKTPSEVYRASERKYKGLPDLHYPLHDDERVISKNGTLILPGKNRVFVSAVLSGQPVGLTELEDDIWKITFMDYDLGYFDYESCQFIPLNLPPEKNKLFPTKKEKV